VSGAARAGHARSGGCQCGSVRYEIRGEPLDIYCCHCSECRRQSASAFGISVIVRSTDLRLLAGRPSVYRRPTRAGGAMACFFCPDCGTRVWHGDPAAEAVVSVKGGSLDAPPDLSRARHIWTSRKLPGVILPEGAETWPEDPPARDPA
jgi:hypothetical protein